MPLPITDLPLLPKATGAYKTISEVSDEIDVPQHVLRFWESRFPQVKPSRMRGSRRYYRPEDVETLKTIKTLLYSKGFTINGAKKVVSGKVEHVSTMPATTVASQTKAPVLKKMPAHKNTDRQELVSELRVLKSMLTALL